MVKLEPNRQKIPARKGLIYLLLILAILLILAGWSRIAVFVHTLLPFSN
jgi:hypothetical protein